MKLKNVLKIVFIVSLIITFFVIININNSISFKKEQKSFYLENFQAGQTEPTEDVYDVILFFGQSNMQGSMSIGIETRYQLNNNDTVKSYSRKTGIAEDIINQSWVTNYTITNVEPNTVYEYHVLNNSLYDLSDLKYNGYTSNGGNITTHKFNGELLYYDYTTYKFYGRWSNDRPDWINEYSYSFSNAYGTNMINEFAKTYYERTGHKVVCVDAAIGGQSLEHFSPNVTYEDEYGTNINLYDGMSNKYLAAIKYLEDNNLKIGNKFFVMFQGENEAGQNSSSMISTYKNNFQRIKLQLYQDLGINKGAIILTGFYPGLYNGTSYALGVKSVNQAQTQLINENSDVILGSDFPFKHYVPGEADYNNTSSYGYKANMGGVDYSTALANAKLVVGGEYDDNLFHFTSAALAQIGRETATNLCNSMIKDISTMTVTLEQNLYTYDGTAKTPKVTVRDGNTILTSGVDYTVSYTNNVNVGTASVIIIGKGVYIGSKELTFEIEKAEIEADISGYNGIYDGANHGISIVVRKPQTGAIVRYGTSQGNYTLISSPIYKDLGIYTVYYEITATNYETKTGSAQIQISGKTINELNVSLKQTEYIYDGMAKTPEVVIKDGNTSLIKDEHYTVSYKDNTNVGTAKVIITGKGEYVGSKELTFEIKKAQIEADISGYNGTYDGANHGISIVVRKPQTGAIVRYGTSQGNYTLTSSPIYKDLGIYTVYYEITATNYETKTGSAQVQISGKTINELNVSLKQTEYIYDGMAKTPEVVIKDENTNLIKDEHYTVSYKDNTNAGTAKVIITGKGEYVGNKELTFEIKKAQIEANVSGYNGTYDGTNHGISIEVIKSEDEVTIKYGSTEENYTLTESPTYKNAGIYTIYYEITATNYETKIGSAQVKINKKEISKLTANLKTITYTYDGKEKKPEVEVMNGNTTLIKDVDYRVNYSDNVNAGTAIVTIEGKGNYVGKITKQFEIKKSTETQNPNENNKPSESNKLEENKNDDTIAPDMIPKAGMKKRLVIIMGIAITSGISVICFIKYRKWNI